MVVMLSNCQNPVGIRFLIVIAIVCSIHTLDIMDGNTQHGNHHMNRMWSEMAVPEKLSRQFLGKNQKANMYFVWGVIRSNPRICPYAYAIFAFFEEA